VQQIVSRALISTEIVDILEAVGLEALCKLLNEEIRSHSRVNVVHTRVFSERLESAIARYQNNAVTTAQVIQELIGIAKEIRGARNRGEEQGQSQDEIAFYDALAENESAVQVMGGAQLRIIAHELLTDVKNSVTIDWAHRESARARIRVLVKKILRKYGYPPDLQDAAVQTVLQEAEVLSEKWAA
jgi:type I restriction enzyme R subunit